VTNGLKYEICQLQFDKQTNRVYPNFMNERDQTIVETAFKLFAHYGVGKTSMTEIAAGAQVARQTLYKSFESKEDLIYAALLHYSAKTKSDVARDCATATDLGARLDVLFEHMAAIPFDAIQRLPHLDEVLEIADRFPPDRKARIKSNYTEAIGLVLAPYADRLRSADISPEHLPDLMKSALTQIKRDAKDLEALRDLFGPLRGLIVASAER
jgi:AcrR family transcriptional regulator